MKEATILNDDSMVVYQNKLYRFGDIVKVKTKTGKHSPTGKASKYASLLSKATATGKWSTGAPVKNLRKKVETFIETIDPKILTPAGQRAHVYLVVWLESQMLADGYLYSDGLMETGE
jgi:hypothetical protein